MKTYLSVMMNNTVTFLLCFILPLFCCVGQKADEDKVCNRDAVDKSIARLLPKGICIPEGYTVEHVIKDFDFNGDGKYDVAVRYVKYPLEDGNMRYYSVYEQISDTIFSYKKVFNNVAYPFIKSYSENYRKRYPVVDSLLMIYPTGVKFLFSQDTIKIEHIIPDLYHKTYSFVYDKKYDNWYLQKVNYWIGELPVWLVRNGNLREELLEERIYLDKKIPDKHISIDEFDLIESKRIADIEESAYLMNNYDIFEIGAKD